MSENNQNEMEHQSRIRRQRQHTNQEESDEFWKNNKYFQEVEDEEQESEEYYPQKTSSKQSDENSKSNNSEDYIDSLEDQWEDESDSLKQQEQKQIQNDEFQQQQQSLMDLIKQNLSRYSTMRGAHSQVDISTLKRIEQTSYVYYDEKQTFNQNYNDLFNRYYKSIPEIINGNDNEQLKCKTQFHDDLFKYEDKRYYLDLEILQLKRILKIYKQQNFVGFLAFRKVQNEQGIDFEQTVLKQIERLKERKLELQNDEQNENMSYYLAIDQEFYLKIQDHFKQISPKYIQQITNQKIEDIKQDSQKAFFIYPNNQQPDWLLQYSQTYNIFKQTIPNLQPPLDLMSFQDSQAIKIASHLSLKAIKQLGNDERVKLTSSLFIDLINGLFNIDIPEKDLLFISDLLNKEVLNILTNQKTQNLQEQQNQLKPFPQVDDPNDRTKTQVKFYPNFQTEDVVLYCRPVLEYALKLFYEIYLRIQKITQLKNKIQYKDQEYILCDLLFEICYKYLEDEITDAAWMTICRSIFGNEQSLQFIPLIQMVCLFRRVLFQLDEWTLGLVTTWIHKSIGEDCKMNIKEIEDQLVSTEIILKRLSQEAQPNTKISRIQAIDGLVIIHCIELSQLY